MSETPAPRVAQMHDDGLARCNWPGRDPLYVAYHDNEWGVPEYDSCALFEKLILDGFQAGLSWITILRKRDAFRAAFADFQPEKIARFNAKKIEALMLDAGIVRNRSKIESAIVSARSWIAIEEREGFSHYLWKHFDGVPLQNHFRHMGEVPPQTPLSLKISKDLKKEGFNFVGPTIVYAFMEACGFVDDHLVGCHRHGCCGHAPQ